MAERRKSANGQDHAFLYIVLNVMLIALLVALFLLSIKQRNALLLGNQRIAELNTRLEAMHEELKLTRERLAKAREEQDELLALADSQALAAAEAKAKEAAANQTGAAPSPTAIPMLAAQQPREIPQAIAPVQPPAQQSATGNVPEYFNQMIVNQRLQEIERFTEITEDQKRRLSERFTKEREILTRMREQGPFDPLAVRDQMSQLETVEDILGADTANAYREHQQQRREERRAERYDRVVGALSDRLSLAPEQQQRVRDVYAEAQEESRRTFSELNQQALSQGAVDMKRISEIMKVAADRRRATLLERMKDILNPEQYERFQQEQGTDQ